MDLACLLFLLFVFSFFFSSCAHNVLEQIAGFLTSYRSVSDNLSAIFIGLFGMGSLLALVRLLKTGTEKQK